MLSLPAVSLWEPCFNCASDERAFPTIAETKRWSNLAPFESAQASPSSRLSVLLGRPGRGRRGAVFSNNLEVTARAQSGRHNRRRPDHAALVDAFGPHGRRLLGTAR